MKKLYRVTQVCYVMAESYFDAEYMDTTLSEKSLEIQAVDSDADIDPEWLDSVPIGSDGDRTCRQIVLDIER